MEHIGLATLLHEVEHTAPIGHPENHFRLESSARTLLSDGHMRSVSSDPAPVEAVTAVHDPAYVRSIEELAQNGGGPIDADTYVTPGSYDAALAVSGAAMRAVDGAFGGGPKKSFILGRPPGHHAKKGRGMGFCLINNAAVAAHHAIESFGVRRVAIFDFDVHHGNGTQDIFWDRNDVLYISTHQYPFYPGTGAASDVGVGDGEGYTRNFPLDAGCSDDDICLVLDDKIIPALEEYEPELIIVSAGFDGHALDPLGGFHLTERSYHHFGRQLAAVADKLCEGRMVSLLEGGYEARANLESIVAYIEGIRES